MDAWVVGTFRARWGLSLGGPAVLALTLGALALAGVWLRHRSALPGRILALALGSLALLALGDSFVQVLAGWCGLGLALGWGAGSRPGWEPLGATLLVAGYLLLFWAMGGNWLREPSSGSLFYLPDPGYTAPSLFAQEALPRAFDAEGQPLRVGPTLDLRELAAELSSPASGEQEHLEPQRALGLPVTLWISLALGLALGARLASVRLAERGPWALACAAASATALLRLWPALEPVGLAALVVPLALARARPMRLLNPAIQAAEAWLAELSWSLRPMAPVRLEAALARPAPVALAAAALSLAALLWARA